MISDTDLLELAVKKTFALSTAISNDGNIMAFYCRDRQIRIFEVRSGKLLRTLDESLQLYIDYQNQKGTTQAQKGDMLYLEKLDFERRMAVEKDLER